MLILTKLMQNIKSNRNSGLASTFLQTSVLQCPALLTFLEVPACGREGERRTRGRERRRRGKGRRKGVEREQGDEGGRTGIVCFMSHKQPLTFLLRNSLTSEKLNSSTAISKPAEKNYTGALQLEVADLSIHLKLGHCFLEL